MKKIKRSILVLLSIISLVYFSACGGPAAPAAAKTVTFKVWGNCGRCKETIESSLKTNGVINADWNKTTKIMTIEYDTTKISLDDIHKKIASVGYDTEKMKGDDNAYNALHECCQYERKD